MLKKLLKYDMKWIYKLVSVFYVLALIFSLLARLFGSVGQSLLCTVLQNICAGAAVGMMISCLINTLMRSWVRFVRNIYKDESYLTHTLPVEKKTIFLSKVLSALLVCFTTIFMIILSLLLCYYSKENFELLKQSLNMTAFSLNTSVWGLLVMVAVLMLLELLTALLCGYLGIILGHRAQQYKMALSVVWGIVGYLGGMALLLGLFCLAGLFNDQIMNLIHTTDALSLSGIKTAVVFCLVVYALEDIVLYIAGSRLLRQGVNVD